MLLCSAKAPGDGSRLLAPASAAKGCAPAAAPSARTADTSTTAVAVPAARRQKAGLFLLVGHHAILQGTAHHNACWAHPALVFPLGPPMSARQLGSRRSHRSPQLTAGVAMALLEEARTCRCSRARQMYGRHRGHPTTSWASWNKLCSTSMAVARASLGFSTSGWREALGCEGSASPGLFRANLLTLHSSSTRSSFQESRAATPRITLATRADPSLQGGCHEAGQPGAAAGLPPGRGARAACTQHLALADYGLGPAWLAAAQPGAV